MEEYGYPLKSTPADWLEAFSALKQLLKKTDSDNRKKVVFIDELPWLDTPKSDLLAAFESFWNGWGAQQDNLMLVVCGSATTWISKNLLEDVGGLFNRAARRIYLRPFTLNETERYFQSRGIQWSRYDIVQTYMIMGGIPYYLKLLDGTVPLSVNIDKEYESRLRKKISVFKAATKTKSAVRLVMITTYGVKPNSHSGIVSANVTMDNLFAAGA